MQHNEVLDLIEELLADVRNDLGAELCFTSLRSEEFMSQPTSREDNARCDVAARGF